jgi:HlyD family secretion protein
MANPKAKRKKRRLVVFGMVLLLVALGLTAAFKRKEVAITIQTEKVTRRNLTELVVGSGKVEPVHQVNISPEVSGEILELPFKEGQCVKKGDLLVRIRPDNYVATRDSSFANYKSSIANSNSAAASLEKAELEYHRNQALFKDKLISDSDYLTAKTTYDVALASLAGAAEQVSMAHASLQSAESDLSKTKIFSPLDGTVSKLNCEVGERVVGTAMMAGTEIMTVADLTEMEARVDIGEMDVVLIAPGQKARLEVDAFKDRKFNGTVTDIANSAKNNDTSNTAAAASSSSTTQDATKFQVKIRLKDKEAFLPGMSVTAEIETRSRTNVITVPIQSVTRRLPKEKKTNGKTNTVDTATVAQNDPSGDPKANDPKPAVKANEPPKPVEVVFIVEKGRAKMVPVKHGIEDDDYEEIVEGLAVGQEVISGGSKAINRDLEDGKKVVAGSLTPEKDKAN